MASSGAAGTPASDSYRLPREEWESQRLNEQHNLFTTAQGYLIHPEISKTLDSNSAIADVAAGTGVWLLEVAKKHDFGSSAALHAFDISDAQYPPEASRPANMRFHVADLKREFSEEFHARFDLVHVRLLCGALNKNEWLPAVKNLMKLLKPGSGYLQWEEGMFSHAATPLRGLATSNTENLRRGFARAYALGWNEDATNSLKWLEPAFRQSDLQDVKLDIVGSDRLPKMRESTTRITMGVVRAVTWKHTTGDGEGAWSIEENEKLIQGMEDDMRSGGYNTWDIAVMLGRNPP